MGRGVGGEGDGQGGVRGWDGQGGVGEGDGQGV